MGLLNETDGLSSIVINLVRLGKGRDAITFWHDVRHTRAAARLNAAGAADLRKDPEREQPNRMART
jgi:hypothetical protein